MSRLDTPAVRRVRDVLAAAGMDGRVRDLDEAARTAEDAAAALGAELGQIVKSLVFVIGGDAVMALVAGDMRCVEKNLPRALGLEGETQRAGAETVKEATGFSIGGVAPVGLARKIPLVIDSSFERFETVYAAAGHPHCIFGLSPGELHSLTGGAVSKNIAAPAQRRT